MTLDPANVPTSLIPLIPIAQAWGIGDDFEREEALNAASRDELRALVASIDEVSDDDFYGWLAGPESFKPNPSDEYIAMSSLAMAIDSAKQKLRSKVP